MIALCLQENQERSICVSIMEEDQEVLHQRENQGSLANGEGEVSLRNNENGSCMCHVCNKSFKSGKALGGHMRIHNLPKKQFQRAKQGTAIAAKPKSENWVLVSGNPTCSLCGKSFSSMKSLFGHMRSHPERVRRGILHSNKTLNNGDSSNSTSSSTLSDDSAVDLSQALKGCWSVTAKRGRKSPSCSNANSGLEENEIEPSMLEAANELMLLASGNPKWEEELDDGHIEEKPLNKMGCEEDVLSLNQLFFGNSDVMKFKKRSRKKMKLTELEISKDENKLVVRCRICDIIFPSHQALEGHLCISKNIQVMDESESSDVSATKVENHSEGTNKKVDETGTVLGDSAVEAMRGHKCKIFNKTFSTGQVFGDHKRSNWSGMAQAQSAQATSSVVENGQNCSKILSFDLNQLPAMDEKEGVQSDLFIPANNMTSSSYDSSS